MLVARCGLEARSVVFLNKFGMFLKKLREQLGAFLKKNPAFRIRLFAAIGAYSVSAIFGLAFLLMRVVAPDTSLLLALGVAIGAAAPLALALLWGRLATLKIGPFRIELTQFEVSVVSLNLDLTYLTTQFSADSLVDLTNNVLKLISKPDTELVEVNLRTKPYWWPSRLFLLAALLDDWTDIRRVVFVTGDDRRDYVGMARPHVIRRSIANAQTEDRYEAVYREAEALADKATKSFLGSDLRQERLTAIGRNWQGAYMAVNSPTDPNLPRVDEPGRNKRQPVAAQELRRLLGDGLSVTSVEWDGGPGTTLDYYLILYTGEEFVALTGQAEPETGQRQLKKAVSASSMAIEISRQVLRRQLEGGR